MECFFTCFGPTGGGPGFGPFFFPFDSGFGPALLAGSNVAAGLLGVSMMSSLKNVKICQYKIEFFFVSNSKSKLS